MKSFKFSIEIFFRRSSIVRGTLQYNFFNLSGSSLVPIKNLIEGKCHSLIFLIYSIIAASSSWFVHEISNTLRVAKRDLFLESGSF